MVTCGEPAARQADHVPPIRGRAGRGGLGGSSGEAREDQAFRRGAGIEARPWLDRARSWRCDPDWAVLAGRYPVEGIEFGEQLKVSRSAYREAIRILAAKGLVENCPKIGTRVSERSRWNVLDPEVLAWTFASEPSEMLIRDLFDLRMIVEPPAAALAAERRTGADLADMGRALGEMARFGLDTDAGRGADQAFHHAVLAAARDGR